MPEQGNDLSIQIGIQHDWERKAHMAAYQGRLVLLKESIIPQMRQAGIQPDWKELANGAARGGQRDLLKDFIIPQMHQAGIQPDWKALANRASQGGQRDLLKDFIIPQMQQVGIQPDWNELADRASQEGENQDVGDYIRGKRFCKSLMISTQGLSENAHLPNEMTEQVLTFAFPQIRQGTISNIIGRLTSPVENNKVGGNQSNPKKH